MKVVNVVMSGKLRKGIDIRTLEHCVYRPEKFSGGVYDHMGCTFLLFATGSFVCLGARNKKIAKRAIKSLAVLLGSSVMCCSTKNMVMAHKLGHMLDMPRLYEHLRQQWGYVTFEDELFSGISWKEGKGTVRLFHTGSFFVTGLCKVKELTKTCRRVCKLCSSYKVIKGVRCCKRNGSK